MSSVSASEYIIIPCWVIYKILHISNFHCKMEAEGKRSLSVPNLKAVCSKVTTKDLREWPGAGGQLLEASRAARRWGGPSRRGWSAEAPHRNLQGSWPPRLGLQSEAHRSGSRCRLSGSSNSPAPRIVFLFSTSPPLTTLCWEGFSYKTALMMNSSRIKDIIAAKVLFKQPLNYFNYIFIKQQW